MHNGTASFKYIKYIYIHTLIRKSKLEVHNLVQRFCQQTSYNVHADDWLQLRNTHTVNTCPKKD